MSNSQKVQEREVETSFSGDSVPSINNTQELQNLLFNASAMNQLQQLATIMSRSVVTVPKHLQGNPGDCMAICMQAAQWGMNPFAVAQKTHVVNGTLGYEAQLVNAVLQASGAIVGRFHYEYRKEGQAMECRVGAIVRGESEITWNEWLRIGDVKTKNSPVWTTNPKQQIGYLQVKNWGRQYCPGAILGVYTVDEIEAYAGTEREIGPTPAPTGQAQRPTGYISEEQAAELLRLARIAGVDEQYVCDKAHVSSLHDIKALRFEAAANHLKKLAEMNTLAAEEVTDAQDS